MNYLEYVAKKQVENSYKNYGDHILTGGVFWTRAAISKHPKHGLVYANVFFTDSCDCMIKIQERCHKYLILDITQN